VKGYFGIFGLDNQLGGADIVAGVANMANELNKLNGADEASVIIKVNKIVTVNEPFGFVVCSPSEYRINFESTTNQKSLLERDSLSKRPLCSSAARWEVPHISFG
jgi:hypothetical protein